MNREAEASVRQSLDTWLIKWMADEFGLDPREVDVDQTFLSYGMNSVQAIMLVGDLEARLGLRLPPTLAWDYPNLSSLSRHLLDRLSVTPSGPTEFASATGHSEPSAAAGAPSEATAPDPRALLEQLDGLSESELDLLLAKYLRQRE